MSTRCGLRPWSVQHDDSFGLAGAHELAHAGDAAGIVDAHAELDGAAVQYSRQPVATSLA